MFSDVLKTTTTDMAACEKPVEVVESEPKASLEAQASLPQREIISFPSFPPPPQTQTESLNTPLL